MSRNKKDFPVLTYKRGRNIFNEGDEGDKAFLIKSGVVCVFRQSGDEKTILAHLGAGQILGETAIITGEPRTASAEAASSCQLVSMTAKQIKGALDQGLPFIQALLEQILQRYRDMEKKHIKRNREMSKSLKQIRADIENWKKSDVPAAPETRQFVDEMDQTARKALKKEKYVALDPKGYMRL